MMSALRRLRILRMLQIPYKSHRITRINFSVKQKAVSYISMHPPHFFKVLKFVSCTLPAPLPDPGVSRVTWQTTFSQSVASEPQRIQVKLYGIKEKGCFILFLCVFLFCFPCSGEKRRFKNNFEDDLYFLSFSGDVCFCFDNISVLLLFEMPEQYKYFEIMKKSDTSSFSSFFPPIAR